MTKIVYMTVGKLDRPIGGVMVQAAHVATLRRHGYDAVVGTTYGRRPDWITEDAPFLDSRREFALEPCDVMVLHDSVPRHHFLRLARFGMRKVFFCQNHYYLQEFIRPGERLADFGFSAVLCVSEPIADYLRRSHGIADPVVIRPAILHPPPPERAKAWRVCYMPRKRQAEIALVMYRARYGAPDLARMPWISIHEKHPDEVARIMAESAVFLSFSYHEGLGMPPLEAMQAGCLVIGYHGGGGRDYATAENGLWYDEPTPDNLVPLLTAAMRRLRDEPGAFADIVAAGRRTAARYDRASMDAALLSFWRSFLG